MELDSESTKIFHGKHSLRVLILVLMELDSEHIMFEVTTAIIGS